MSIQCKLILVVTLLFAAFIATAIFISVDMLSNAFDAGQSRHTQQLIDLTLDMLRKNRSHEVLHADSLIVYENQAVTAMADYKQRQVVRDDLLKKIVVLLLVNAIPFLLIGYFVIVFFVSRAIKPVVLLTKKISRYPDISPNDLRVNPRADKEVRLLTGQFKTMLENILAYQKKLQARSKVDGWMEMSRAIVHEVGNAITPAKNSVEQLKKECPDNLHVVEVQKSVVRMEEVFRHIRQFYTTQTIIRMPFDLVAEVQFVCSGYGAGFSNATDFKGIMISGGKTEFTQMLANLIKNATESVAAPAVANVQVQLALSSEFLQITIADNGCGIPPDALEKIFSPGYSSKSTGFGIGLTLVKKIITLHEWALSVASEPGAGSTFTITIPKRDILERVCPAA